MEDLRHRLHLKDDQLKKRLIAEELRRALPLNTRANELVRCPREESFSLLYQYLGNAEAQDEIRNTNADKRHCRWLKASPTACLCLPIDIPDTTVKAGMVCPNNPFEKDDNRTLFESAAVHADLVRIAHSIGDVLRMDLLPGLDELTPEEFEIARVMRAHYRAEDIEVNQAIQDRAIAKLFASQTNA